MKGVYKFYSLIYLVLLLLLLHTSFVNAAVIYGGKVYSGDTFTSNMGGNFTVLGIDSITIYNNDTSSDELHYKKILIRSDVDESITVRNGTCAVTHMYNYCYRSSAVDFDNPKTFEGNGIRAAMTITVESLPNPVSIVTFSRDNKIISDCGIYIPRYINVKNSGTIPTIINYSEYLPLNTVVVNANDGIVTSNIITFSDRILSNTSKNYTYTIANLDCEPKFFNAKYAFTTFNGTITKNITNISIVVNEFYNFTDALYDNKTNSLKNETTYMWNITNSHPSLSINAESIITLPKGLVITQMSPDIKYVNDTYHYSGILSPDFVARLFLKFYASDYGNYTVLNKGIIIIHEHEVAYYSNKTLQVISPNVTASIEVDTSKVNSLYVTVRVRNFDLREKYYYIYGVIQGLGNDEPIYANSIDPDGTLIFGNKTYNITGKNWDNITLIFDGLYRDKETVEHKLYSAKTVTAKGEVIIVSTPDNNQVAAVNTISNNTNTIKNNSASSTKPHTKNNTVNSTDTSTVAEKDILTRMIEGLNNLLQAIFG